MNLKSLFSLFREGIFSFIIFVVINGQANAQNFLADSNFDSSLNIGGQFPNSWWIDMHIGQAGAVCDGVSGHYLSPPFGLHVYTGQDPSDYLSYPSNAMSIPADSCFIVTAGAQIWNPDTSIYGWVPGSKACVRLWENVNNNWIFKESSFYIVQNSIPHNYQIVDTLHCGTTDLKFAIWLEKPQVSGQSIINVDNCYLYKTSLPNSLINISINSSKDSICTGDFITFSATVSNGGCSPTYQWKRNGSNVGINSPVFSTYTLLNDDSITCTVTSSASCVTGSPGMSNIIIMKVNPLPSTPVISLVGNELISSALTGNQWYFNNDTIPNAMGQNYTPIQNGNYYVIVTDLNGCISDTSNIYNITTNVEEFLINNGIETYPNPTNGKFHISIPEFSKNKKYKFGIYNMFGENIYLSIIEHQISNEINLANSPKGIYFLKVYDRDLIFITKIVIH